MLFYKKRACKTVCVNIVPVIMLQYVYIVYACLGTLVFSLVSIQYGSLHVGLNEKQAEHDLFK